MTPNQCSARPSAVRSHFGSSSFAQVFILDIMVPDDPIRAGPAVRSEPGPDPDGIRAGPLLAVPALRAPRRGGHAGRPREAPREGTFVAWLVRDSVGPILSSSSAAPPAAPEARCVFALARCEWQFRPDSDEARAAHALLEPPRGRDRRGAAWVFLKYTAVERWELSETIDIPRHENLDDDTFPTFLEHACADIDVRRPQVTVRTLLRTLPTRPTCCVSVFLGTAEEVLAGDLPCAFRSVRLGGRVDYTNIVKDNPRRQLICSWRNRVGARRRNRPAGEQLDRLHGPSYEDVLLELPRKRAAEVNVEVPNAARHLGKRRKLADPIHLIRGLSFCGKLRSVREFTNTLNLAHDFDHPNEPRRNQDNDPSRTTLDVARQKADVISMLLSRREFRADAMFDRIESINVFTDSSPIVGGELQGMIIDVCKTDPADNHRLILPGSSLCYSHFDAVSKTIGLLWALWLVGGPDETTLRYLLTKIGSTCTDMGIEHMTLQCPDVLQAFLSWVGGAPLETCRTQVNHDKRLLENAIRLAGWSHGMGNVMSIVSKKVPGWPEKLEKLRCLTSFWRNMTYRNHAMHALRDRPDVDASVLKTFDGSFAKWRYETLAVNLKTLAKYRAICENHVTREWFQNVQDAHQLETVLLACADKEFWRWVVCSSREVFSPCEKNRHWGMICTCPDHVRQRTEDHKKHVPCFCFNSRRLRHAWTYIQDESAKYLARAAELGPDDCEGDALLVPIMKSMLVQLSGVLVTRHKYLKSAPWSFARADEVEGARLFLAQYRSRPPDQHDPVTVKLGAEHEAALESRANGDAPTEALTRAVKVFSQAALDESVGEGYHARTTREKKRAVGSTLTHLKRTTRFQACLLHIRGFCDRFGARGKDVVRYEWRCWSRVCQPNPRKRWVPKLMKRAKLMARIYREDQMAETDWKAIASMQRDARPVRTDDLNNLGACRNEYMGAQVAVGRHYAVEVPHEVPADDEGSARVENKQTVFEVLDIAQGTSRPHLIHTSDSADDVALRAPLALQVQFYDHREPCADDPVADGEHVYLVGEPKWVVPEEIAEWEIFHKKLYKFRVVEGSQFPGCLVLTTPVVATPPYDLMDSRCPALALVNHLLHIGWKAVDRRVAHTTLAVGDFDGRAAIRQKTYFQVVASLDRCLPNTSSVPSRECISFYRLLLLGHKAEPGGSDASYMMVLNAERLRETKNKRLEPVPIAVPAPDPNMDPIMAPGIPRGPSPPRPKRAPGVRVVRDKPVVPLPMPDPPVGPPIVGEPVRPVPPIVPPVEIEPPPPVPVPLPPRPDDDDGIMSGPAKAAPPLPPPGPRARGTGREKRGFVPTLDGAEAYFKNHTHPVTRKSYANFILKCPRHVGCEKTKGFHGPHQRAYGDVGALAYLHAWIPTNPEPGKTHTSAEPTVAEVAAYAEARRADLERAFAMVCPDGAGP